MFLRFSSKFKKDKARRQLAVDLASVKCPSYPVDPWMPNEGDTSYWKFDSGNDWGLSFKHDDPCLIEIRYRYHHAASTLEEEFVQKMRDHGIDNFEIVNQD